MCTNTSLATDGPLVEFNLRLDDSLPAAEADAPLTFEQLCELEPRLLALFNEARAVKDDKRKRSFCANQVWYGRREYEGFKPRLLDLVGWTVKRNGGDARLATSRAYDVAYHKIYDALPDCRNCICWGFQRIIDERLGRR